MDYKDVNAIILIVLCYGAVIVLGFMLFGGMPPKVVPEPVAPAVTQSPLDSAPGFLFTCTGDTSLKADFGEHYVRLTLSDGRQITLPQAISADGGRYANPDESFVFWNKGNTAFIEERGTRTYTDCVTKNESGSITP